MRPPFRALTAALLVLAACDESPTLLAARDTLLTSASGASAPAVDTNYTLVDLGAQDICSCFRFILDPHLWFNDQGAIAGGGATPFVWDSSAGFTYLPDLGGGPIVIVDFNQAGQVAGTAPLPSGLHHAVLWSQGTLTDLGTLGGEESAATAISQNGRVVGWSHAANGETHAFSWSGGRMKDLNPPGRSYSVATAVEDRADRVAMQVRDSSVIIRVMLWDRGAVVDLGPPPGVPPGMDEDLRVATAVGFTHEGLLLGKTRYESSRQEQDYRSWIWNGDSIEVLPTLIDNDRRSAIPIAIAGDGTVAVQEYWFDQLTPTWDTELWSGGSLQPAFTGAYPPGTAPSTIHLWQMDRSGILVGGVAKPYPVINGVYAVTLRNGAMKVLPDLHGLAANALAINRSRDIAGWASDSASGARHLVVWRRKDRTP